jgi:hypothetical protein
MAKRELNVERRRAVLVVLSTAGTRGLTNKAIAADIGAKVTATSYDLRRLRGGQLVKSIGKGRATKWCITKRGGRQLRPLKQERVEAVAVFSTTSAEAEPEAVAQPKGYQEEPLVLDGEGLVIIPRPRYSELLTIESAYIHLQRRMEAVLRGQE